MDKLIEKVSSYNIFTNLFPGVIFCFFVDRIFGLPLIQNDIVVGLFFYYFVGMIISRVGSIVLEPLFLKVGFLEHAPHKAYLNARRVDPAIDSILETNNSYRSVLALIFCIVVIAIWLLVSSAWMPINEYAYFILLLSLFVLFLLALRKQTKYLKSRITNTTGAVKDDPKSN